MEAFAPIDTLIPMFLNAGKNSNDYLGEIARGFFELTIWAAIFWGALRVTVGADSLEGTSAQAAGWFLRIYIIGTIGAFLLPTIIPALIEGALGIGTGISGGTMSAADFLLPSRLAIVGWTEVEKLIKHAMSRCNGFLACITSSISLAYYAVASFVILVSFVAMIIMIILSYIYFIMEGIGTLINIGFMAGDKLSWLGRGGLATLASRFNQMIIMSASLSIGSAIFERIRLSGDPSLAQAVVAAVVAVIIAILTFNSEKIAASIIGGTPGTQTNQMAVAALGAAAGLAGAGAASSVVLGRSALGAMSEGIGRLTGGNSPPPPPMNDGTAGGTVSRSGEGHGSNPFGGSSASRETSAQSAAQAAATISEQARQMPKGSGEGAEAPTSQQWQDAQIMGTDIAGMTRSQAGNALAAHQSWFESRSGSGNSTLPALSVGAPADWMQPGSVASKSSANSGHALPETRKGFGADPLAVNSGDQPPMRSAAIGSARRTFSPKSASGPAHFTSGSHSNDGRYMISENYLHSIGLGGGQFGTGYHGVNWNGVSGRRAGVSALTGEGANRRAEQAMAREVHFGQKSSTSVIPKSAAVHS